MGRQKQTGDRSKFKVASSSGFGGQQTGFFTGFGQDQLDQNLDPRLRVALRKISKKDATTKVKGMFYIQSLDLRFASAFQNFVFHF